MKSIIFLLFLPFASLLAQEDFSLRNVAGGHFSFSLRKSGGASIDNPPIDFYYGSPNRILDMQPYLAWKIKRNTLFGLRLGYQSVFTLYEPIDFGIELRNYDRTYSMGVFTRHFLTPEKAFRFFLEPSLGAHLTVNSRREDDDDREAVYHVRQASLKVSPGVTYQLSQHFGLLAKFGQFGLRTGKLVYEFDADVWFREFFADASLAAFALGVEYRW
jgi:hypothetical protein